MKNSKKVLLTDRKYKPHVEFWRSMLFSTDGTFSLNNRGKQNAAFSRSEQQIVIDGKLYELLFTLSKGNDTGNFIVILSIFVILFKRYANCNEVIIDSPFNSLQSDAEIYAEKVPLIFNIQDDLTLKEHLNCVRNLVKGAYDYQNFPLDVLDAQRIRSNVIIIDQSIHTPFLQADSYDLIIVIKKPDPTQIAITFQYNTIFEKYFIENIGTHFLKTLTYFTDLQTTIRKIEISSEADIESAQLVNAANGLFPVKRLEKIFEEQVEKNPDKIALVSGRHFITYKELDEKANQLANYLRHQYNLDSTNLIGLLFDNSEWAIISVLSILKLGIAYVPIDRNYPYKRIKAIIDDSSLNILVTDQLLSKQECDFPERTEIVLVNNAAVNEHSRLLNSIEKSQKSWAYIIYTSGSTGVPKGVVISHMSVVNLIEGLKHTLGLEKDWRYILTSSISFDASVKQIFAALTSGSELHLYPDLSDIGKLIEYINVSKINTLHLSPEVWKVFLKEHKKSSFSSLKLISSGGDVLSAGLANRMLSAFEGCKIINTYGPTEVCVNALTYPILSETVDFVPIGKSLPNYKVYILDNLLRIQPLGAVGEICISGIGIAQGYLNLPDSSENCFIVNPFEPNTKLYKTGDLGCLLPGGNIRFLGRNDAQVKIRGFRIETQEIELSLLSYPGIENAKVVLHKDEKGTDDKYLIACLTGNHNSVVKDNLMDYLYRHLPAYMVPSKLLWLAKFPVNLNGKLDDERLHVLIEEQLNKRTAYVAPRNTHEEKLIHVWQNVLCRSEIGVKDRFFDLGGHSLKAMQIVSQLAKEFKIKASFKKLLQNISIEEFALTLEDAGVNNIIPAVEEQDFYELSYAQRRLWFMHHLQENKIAYNMLGEYKIEGLLNVKAFIKAFEVIVHRHESLRTTFVQINDEPYQRVHDFSDELSLEYHNLKSLPLNTSAVRGLVQNEINRNFDLEKLPLWKAKLLHTGEHEYIFVINIHHILSDGWSNRVLMTEMLDLYKKYSGEDQDITLPHLSVQYKDYTAWLKQQYSVRNKNPKSILTRKTPPLRLRYDFLPDKNFANLGSRKEIQLSVSQCTLLRNTAAEQSISLSTMLFSMYNILLAKWCSVKDFVVLTLVSNRNRHEIQNLIGPFINFLTIDIHIDDNLRYDEYLLDFSKNLNEWYNANDFPFEVLLDDYFVPSGGKRNPFYTTVYNYKITEAIRSNLGNARGDLGLTITPKDPEYPVSASDLKLDIDDNGEDIKICFEYNTDLFKPATIEQLLARYLDLIELLMKNRTIKIGETNTLFNMDEMPETNKKVQANGHMNSNRMDIHIFSSFVVDPSIDYINYWLKEGEIHFDVTNTGKHELIQRLIKKVNEDTATTETVNLIFLRFEDFARDLQSSPNASNNLVQIYNDLISIFEQLKASREKFIICALPEAHDGLSGSCLETVIQLNVRWELFVKTQKHLQTLDMKQIEKLYEVNEVFDSATNDIGSMPFTNEFYAAMGTYAARFISNLRSPSYKVIAVDCDNTLWKGICGEDPLAEINISGGYAHLQNFLVQKFDEGFLIVLCSKNNEEDVWKIFSHHPDMILRKDHVIASKINWSRKSENLAMIAKELNLNTDSFIFIDDNPVECEEMTIKSPEVLTIELPQDPNEFQGFLNHIWAFDRFTITSEDAQRNISYRSNIEREQSAAMYSSVDDFIKSLDVKVDIAPLTDDFLERASQLTFRTNQFNLNGIRIPVQEIRRMMKQIETQFWMIDVTDRFGTYGFVGLLIFSTSNKTLTISSFLLSCRVLGRKVELKIMDEMENYCRTFKIEKIDFSYIPTEKNKPFKLFLDELKFSSGLSFSLSRSIVNGELAM